MRSVAGRIKVNRRKKDEFGRCKFCQSLGQQRVVFKVRLNAFAPDVPKGAEGTMDDDVKPARPQTFNRIPPVKGLSAKPIVKIGSDPTL